MNPPTGEETIFAEALRLPPDERAAYLAKSTHGNAELRRRVESLLGSYEAGDFLEQAAATQSRPTLHIAVPLTEKPGDTIGRYKLLQQIGEGGCGVVYVAEQAEPVRRRVALKIIKLGMDTKSVIARFEAERQAVAMMDHPNIAKVFDAGATQTGRPYFVMELVRGMKITDYCDEAKLSTGGRLDLFIQVCQAIQHAHQKGIIHRDIKPSNILVTVNDGVPVPKVIDFGIAKATSGQQLTDKTIYTAFEQFIGTPAYMSPEQAVLTSLDIDTRSDIYALGVLLYELLTGKTPFDAKELFAIGLDEMRRTIREQEPQRPSTRISTLAQNELSTTAQRRGIEAPKLVSELRGDLDWIVMKALEKDRARRYETANGLAMDIQRHLKNEPVVACPPSRFYRFQKMVRRNKLAFSASGAVLLALVSGLALATWALVRERAAREQVRTEAARSQQVAQFLKDMLQSVAPSVALGRDTTMLREIMDKTAERADKELTNQPAVRAELLSIIGITYFEMGEFSKAEAVLRTALSLRKNVFGDANAFVAASLYNLGNVLEGRKALAESESMHREALAIRRKLFGNEHPDVATSLSGLASSLYNANRKTEAESAIHESLAILQKLFGSEHLEVADALVTLGWIIAGSGRPAEAEPVLREALTMQAKLAGNDHLSLATYFDRLAGALTSQGKLTESEPFQRQAVAMRKKWLGEKHPYVASSLGRLAEILARQGKMAEAESVRGEQSAILAERGDAQTLNQVAWQMATSDDPKLRDGPTAVSFAEKAVAVTNRKDPRTLDTLAAAYAEVGQFASAVIVQREAIALLQDEELKKECSFRLKLFEANSPYRSMDYDAGALAASAMRLLGQGKFAEAEAHARDCLAIREKNMPGHWGTFSARSMLGGSLLGQKKYADAEPLLRSGYEGLKQRQAQIPGPAKPRMREALQYLVQLYEATGEAVQVTEWKQKLAEFDQPTTRKDGGDGLKKK